MVNQFRAAAVLMEHWIYPTEYYPGQEISMMRPNHKNVRKIMFHLDNINKDSFSLS
jgi:hypothetical protein